ncbi:MAG TPA: hypothetical protein VHF87_15045 [Methylomirabilota bacterium]|jgi:hypothetical protein|nr:hypothetical protein [Methylomirabilota bacterium]
MRKFSALRTAQTRNDRGVALFAAIAGMVLLSTMIAALVILARDENLIAQLNKDEAQAAYAAEAGANWGRRLLLQRLSVDLPAAVSATGRAAMKTALVTSYNSANGGAQFIRDFAIPAGGPTFQSCAGGCAEPNYSAVGNIPDAQQTVMTITCPGTAACPPNMAFTTRVIVGTHPTIPPAITNGGNGALFTYVWRIESSGTSGRARQQWVIHDSSVPTNTVGSFTIALNAEFVKYAHFIDQFQDAGSGEPWMSYRHEYTGPVHTNRRFSILGNISTAGQEGPTFRSEATQTFTTTRFNNSGSATNLSRDSSSQDWPLLGPNPGILCKQVDCSGFTRSFDFDPTTATIDPIPFPGGNNPQDRIAQICMALGIATAACPVAPAAPPTAATIGCAAGPPVIVGANCVGNGALNGGVYVTGNVRDLQLAHTNTGQSIVIYTTTSRRTLIIENWTTDQTSVTRQCLKSGIEATDVGTCNGGAGATWWLDTNFVPALQQQTFTGVFSPSPSTDRGIVFVYNGDVGVVNTSNGLRRGSHNTADVHAVGWVDAAYAIYQDTTDTTRGMRLTVAADGNVWITGHLNYRVDPRGADGVFSDPIPGDPTGTSADDQLDVQNVLGVLSWATPSPTVPTSLDGGVRLSSVLTGDLSTHGMIFAANLSAQAEPSGQFSFDDPNGAYRGISQVVGGVVQKTMGTFGQPSSNLGYARDWVYDERFRYRALSPPAFPGFPNFTAATSLGIDSYTWRLGLF